MSNKKSDENVANIEKDIERCKQLTKTEHANWIGISNQLAITHILEELERKDKRIKELEEENKELKAQHVFTRNEATDKEKAELYDTIDKTLDTFLEKEKAMWEQEMTADKMKLEEALNIVDEMYEDRYKIIEENNTVYVDRLKDVKFTNLEFASVILLREVQSLQRKFENSIPKQVLIDKIKEYKDKVEQYNEYKEQGKETDVEYYENIANTIVIQVLQELLERGNK